MLETVIARVDAFVFSEGASGESDGVWIEALPARVYKTPMYGDVPVSHSKLENFVRNFNSNVRGQEIATDFEHGLDPTKGLQASGWYKEFAIKPSTDDPTQNSLFAKIAFTDVAKQDIKDGKYKYFSLEWDDNYETDTGHKVPDVVIGGGLTNRPVAKRTMPINFSENMWNDLSDDDKKYATRIVLEHKALSDEDTNNAYKLLSEKGFEMRYSEMAAQAHSDPGVGAALYASANDQLDPGFGLFVPRKIGSPSADDPAIGEGWRRDPLPTREAGQGDEIDIPETRPRQPGFSEKKEGGTTMEFSETQVKGLADALGVEVNDTLDADTLVTGATTAFSELKQFKASVGTADKERRFANDYPEQHKMMQEMRERDLTTAAKTFAESNSRIHAAKGTGDDITFEPTRDGLSALALGTIAETHKKLSEGTGTAADFEAAVRAIIKGGIVQFGEVGTGNAKEEPIAFNTSTVQDRMKTRMLFSEKVAEVMAAHTKDNNGEKLSIIDATGKASALYPELAEAYKATA